MTKKQKQKQKVSKVQLEEDEKQMELEASLEPQREESAQAQATDPPHADSDALQATVTSTKSTKRTSGAPRSICAMHKVVMKKAQGKKFQVQYNGIGIPVGDTRHTLQSYIGMLARTMVPIDIRSWPQVDPELKKKLWSDVQDTFKVQPETEKHVLQSAGAKWRQFKATLTTDYVIPYVGQKKKLARPPKKYAFVGKEVWKRFVAMRTTTDWLALNKRQSAIVRNRKYPHRVSRKGYIGLEEEEVSSGRLAPGEVPDRAMLWKMARKPKDPKIEIDEGLHLINEKIDLYLEMKRKGEFKQSGSSDVLTAALETPEHSGRVRGVGSFVSPSTFFNMPKGKRTRVTKDELLARDKKREEEFERRTQEFDKKTENLMKEIAELKALITTSNLHSPMLSDKASCREDKEQQLGDEMKIMCKPVAAKTLMAEIDSEDDCVYIDPIASGAPEIKGPCKCELAVDRIDNKVAFGVVFDEGDTGTLVHGVPLQPGCLRVSVDGIIKPDALVPVPVVGEIETVYQAVGSYLAWPKDLIIFNPTVEKKKEQKKKGELQRVQTLFNTVKLNDNVPDRFNLLYKHATCFMKESGASIQIPCDVELFGIEKTIFVLHENIVALLEFEMLGQAIIATYMAYLHTIVRKKDSSDLYAFVDPSTSTYKLNDEFEAYVVQRLKDGVLRINFMPYNLNFHWILIIIWESEIYILNPLPHPTHFPELEKALMGAVRSFNAQTGRVNKNPKVKNLAGSPKQPGGHECAYVVMRYMKDILEDKEMNFSTRWATKTRKSYTKEELNIVRFETLDYIQAIM